MTIIIVGGGIVGLSTAFYLASALQSKNESSKIIVVDTARQLFTCASGRSAGFINQSWFSQKSVSLAKLSFALHEELAEKYEGHRHWGYRKSQAWSTGAKSEALSSEEYQRLKEERLQKQHESQKNESSPSSWEYEELNEEQMALREPEVPAWVFCDNQNTFPIAGPDECAQIHPHRLCMFLLQQCLALNVEVLYPTQLHSLKTSEDGTIVSAVLRDLHTQKDTTIYDVSKVVIAAGAWSAEVFSSLFPDASYSPPISSLAGFSMTVSSPLLPYYGPIPTSESKSTPVLSASDPFDAADIDLVSQDHGQLASRTQPENPLCDALFVRSSSKVNWCPEIFSRSNGEIYIAGLNAASLHPSSGSMAPSSFFDTDEVSVDDTAPTDLEDIRELNSQYLSNFTTLKQVAEAHLGPDITVLRRSLCRRPITTTGEPIIGEVPSNLLSGTREIYICSGHGPWGISLCLGSGKVISELLTEGRARSADVSGLSVI